MSNLPFVSVIIPTYYDWDNLTRCLRCLQEQSYPDDRFEIIVVNNAPEDRPPIDVGDRVCLLDEGKAGSYAARNKGLTVAKGDVIAFTDSDCQPLPDWIMNGVMGLLDNQDISRVGGKVALIRNDTRFSIGDIYERAFAFPQDVYVRTKGMAVTANMFTYRTVFDNVGLFNSVLLSGGDAEWGKRANVKGFSIAYQPSAVVLHPSRTMKDIIQKARRVAGGHFEIQKSGTLIYRVMKVLLDLVPPLPSMLRVLTNKELTVKEKAISIAIRYYIKLVTFKEKVSLSLGKAPERL